MPIYLMITKTPNGRFHGRCEEVSAACRSVTWQQAPTPLATGEFLEMISAPNRRSAETAASLLQSFGVTVHELWPAPTRGAHEENGMLLENLPLPAA